MAETLAAGGLHRVETVMGIPVGVDVRDDGVDPAVLDRAFAHLRAVDAAFSPYRATSDVRRIAAGTLAVAAARPEVRAVLARCERLRHATGGRFDVHATGRLDPSGFVKGWAVDGASRSWARPARGTCACTRAATSACSASGRPAARGASASSTRPRRGRTAAVLHAPAGGLAVATSGAYERGAHIVDPRTGRPPRGVLSVTVCGPDLGTADAYATAAFAMGPDAPAWTATLPAAFAAMTILDGGTVLSHPRDGRAARGVARSRRRPRASRSCARRCANGWPRCAASRPSACRRRSSTSASSARACPAATCSSCGRRTGSSYATRRAARAAACRTGRRRGRAARSSPARSPTTRRPPGARVLELGCGLGLPSIVAAREGASVLATDGSSDAVVFAAHSLALNELDGEVAEVDWATQGDALVARGPWDVVLAADVLYLKASVEAALALLPRLVAPGGEIRLADPRRAGARDFLAAARASFTVRTRQDGEIALHRLTPRPPGAAARRGAVWARGQVGARLAGEATGADGAGGDLVGPRVVADAALDRERPAGARGAGVPAPHDAALLDEHDAPGLVPSAVDLELGLDHAVAGLELELRRGAAAAGAGDADLGTGAAAAATAAVRRPPLASAAAGPRSARASSAVAGVRGRGPPGGGRGFRGGACGDPSVARR